LRGELAGTFGVKEQLYLDSFKNEFSVRAQRREAIIGGTPVTLWPGVFPSDSPLTYSSESIIGSIRKDFEQPAERPRRNNILDLGTGCGVFAVTLAPWFPNARIVASDIEDVPLMNAAENAKLSQLSNVEVVKSDLFGSLTGSFDLVVTSMPFAKCREGRWAPNELTVLRFWRQAQDYIKDDGLIYFNWADWADFSIAERSPGRFGFVLLRIDEYPRVVGEFSWRTYVACRRPSWTYWRSTLRGCRL
jgi:hypothetical protein